MNWLSRKRTDEKPTLNVLYASSTPDQTVVDCLYGRSDVIMHEAFSTRGAIAGLPGVNLVIMGKVAAADGVSPEVLQNTLDRAQVPVVAPEKFMADTDEWLSRAQLVSRHEIKFLPPRQVNLINWAGGVGKTTLSMAMTRRFHQSTGLPAALLELSLGGSALHARVSDQLPDFYEIATGQAQPDTWEGVHLYPMDGRGIAVLLENEPERVREALAAIQRQHTLFVVDAFPGHPLWPMLNRDLSHIYTFIVTSPRDDAVLQAQRIRTDQNGNGRTLMVLNMAKSLADRVEAADVTLPHKENWAVQLDRRLADPLLSVLYPGWRGK